MFIVVEYGIPHVVGNLPVGERMNMLAAMGETWKQCHAFSSKVRYVGVPSRSFPAGWFRRALAHTVYNPRIDVTREWRESGTYSIREIISLIERGLETDDDIIQQWFGADDVLKLLKSAQTFEELADRVRCVCGEFEVDARLAGIVKGILPNSGTLPESLNDPRN